mmetsp:Transcript_23760/g.51888  ORF Transcript_23760/g.51888 Transcript_23760/m.51888 type:complete len:183 (-) Transcript_23760:708-1256(-)
MCSGHGGGGGAILAANLFQDIHRKFGSAELGLSVAACPLPGGCCCHPWGFREQVQISASTGGGGQKNTFGGDFAGRSRSPPGAGLGGGGSQAWIGFGAVVVSSVLNHPLRQQTSSASAIGTPAAKTVAPAKATWTPLSRAAAASARATRSEVVEVLEVVEVIVTAVAVLVVPEVVAVVLVDV